MNHIRSTLLRTTALALILSSTTAGWAAVISESSGTHVYNSSVSSNSTIDLSGTADATFNAKIGTGTHITIHDSAFAAFNGALQTNVVIDILGGVTTINSIKNNAEINVSGGTLLLNHEVGNSASVNISGGSLELGSDNVFPTGGNQTSLTMSGGTLDTGGYDVAFESLTLTGDSVIDLGDNPDVVVDLGAITGTGTLTVVNWVDANSIIFDPGSSSIDVGTQVMFYPGGAIIDPNNPGQIIPVPVPEPSTYAFGGILIGLGLWAELRRRRNGVSTKSVENL